MASRSKLVSTTPFHSDDWNAYLAPFPPLETGGSWKKSPAMIS